MNFLLVHGTWHGGWVWRDVKDRLERNGHRVFTPSCTGCGERVHLSDPTVGLETHVIDLENIIRFEGLDNLVVVAHSFAGTTITALADRMPDAIRQLIFFDALVPRGDLITCVPRDELTGELPDWWRAREKKFIDGYKMVIWDEYPMDMLLPPEATAERARVKRLVTTHPARQWSDQYRLQNGGWQQCRRAYIHCVGQLYKPSSEFMWGAAKESGWQFLELDIPRDGMLTHPDLVATSFETLSR